MKILLDTDTATLTLEDAGQTREMALYSDEAFRVLSHEWTKVGWNQKHLYTFTWMGRPVIQLPDDMLRMQEVIYQLKPDLIIETGVAHGGSLVFYASLCKAMEQGRVIGIDIEIRPHNRKAIEAHPLFELITLYEGSSTAEDIVTQVKNEVRPTDTVLVILDSNHSYQHVLDELNAYADLVTPNSYIVATDGIMQDLTDVPRGHSEWKQDNPVTAAQEFVQQHADFEISIPEWLFNESTLDFNITHWPSAWIKRVR